MTESSGGGYWRSLFEDLTLQGDPAQDQTGETGASGPFFGASGGGARDGEQGDQGTSAIRSQGLIIEQFTGEEVDEEALIQEALANGWYEPGMGTDPENVGKLLEAHGVSTTSYDNASSFDLANELAQGHKAIVSIDSGELGSGGVISEGIVNSVLEWLFDYGQEADHAVVVTGIDTTDPDNPQVMISDPGTGEAAATYPLDQFLAAWRDSDFRMVATEEPAPPSLPEMSNFDYEAGHISEVAGVPYDEFVEMQGETGEWDELLRLLAQEQPYVPEEPAGTGYEDVVGREAVREEGSPSPQPSEPSRPEPVVDPELLSTAAPGPALSSDLFDPDAPGPTINPDLLDPNAPGPTLDPDLLDPTAPGPTIDPSLLDMSTPGTAVYPDWFIDTLAGVEEGGFYEPEPYESGDWEEDLNTPPSDDACEGGVC